MGWDVRACVCVGKDARYRSQHEVPTCPHFAAERRHRSRLVSTVRLCLSLCHVGSGRRSMDQRAAYGFPCSWGESFRGVRPRLGWLS